MCPLCNGATGNRDCTECHGWGRPCVVACPYTVMDPVALEAIAAAQLLRNGGGWPNGGGWLNECHSLREAVLFVNARTPKSDH